MAMSMWSRMLQREADLDIQDVTGYCAMHYAVSVTQDSIDIMELLLGAGADIDLSTIAGATSLMLAVEQCDEAKVAMLLQRGARVCHTDNTGRSSLMVAAAAHSSTIIALLLSHGAMVNSSDNEGASAVIHASRDSPSASRSYQQQVCSMQAF